MTFMRPSDGGARISRHVRFAADDCGIGLYWLRTCFQADVDGDLQKSTLRG